MSDALQSKDNEIARLGAALNQFKSDFAATSAELVGAQARRDAFAEEIEQLKSSVLIVKASESDAKLQLATATSRVEALAAQLAQVQSERDGALQSLSSESSATLSRSTALQEELHALKVAHANELAVMQEQLDGAAASLSAKDAEEAEKNELISGLSKSVAELTGKNENQRAEVERLTLQLESQINNEQVGDYSLTHSLPLIVIYISLSHKSHPIYPICVFPRQAKKVKIKSYIDTLTRDKTQAAERATELEALLAQARGQAEALAAQCAAKDAQLAQLNHQVREEGRGKALS